MGFAGNCEPNFIIPSVIATNDGKGAAAPAAGGAKASGVKKIDDLDFFIGDEALAMSKVYQCQNPIRHGQVDNWTHMERFWEHCIFKYLRAEPEDHYFLLVRFKTLLITLLLLYCRFDY